jgi:hypothetical protein
MNTLPNSVTTVPDPELEALPEPRRPGRTLTLVTLVVTALAAVLLAFGLRHDLAYALGGSRPEEIGALERVRPEQGLANRFVRADGVLSATVAVRYRRPLESGSYRLAELAGNPSIWVQVRVPEEMEGPHFVAPTSFVGRLLPLEDGGIRLQGLGHAMQVASGGRDVAGAWLLLDDESPASLRYVLGVEVLLLVFASFNAWALVRLLRPVKDG